MNFHLLIKHSYSRLTYLYSGRDYRDRSANYRGGYDRDRRGGGYRGRGGYYNSWRPSYDRRGRLPGEFGFLVLRILFDFRFLDAKKDAVLFFSSFK